jgi:hypothetical protein
MAVASKPITAAERAKRTRIYEEALASVRLEGFELDDCSKTRYKWYIDGELTLGKSDKRSMSSTTESSDPYLYPGTTVLKACPS